MHFAEGDHVRVGDGMGIGQIHSVLEQENEVIVRFFVGPGKPFLLRKYSLAGLRKATLSPQTRVYFQRPDGSWLIGRIHSEDPGNPGKYLISLPDGQMGRTSAKRLYVRTTGDYPMDPAVSLAQKAHETAFFYEARKRFNKELIEQRSLARGMTAFLSSNIALFRHQAETISKVLRDPVQRYLLADEVGLGKTIEAGCIIRQYFSEEPEGSVLVLVPEHLLEQWRLELKNRFHLEEKPGVLEVHPYKKIPGGNAWRFIVVDEVQNLGILRESPQPIDRRIFEKIQSMSHSVSRLLLLSATPVLHNEKDFLTSLNLLDPQAYPLDDLAGFKDKIEKRQEIGRCLLGIRPGLPLMVMRSPLSRLRELFPADRALERMISEILDCQSGDERRLLVRKLHVHIGNAYRLHRRMVRNRRERLETDPLLQQACRKAEARINRDEGLETVERALESWRLGALGTSIERPSLRGAYERIYTLLAQATGSWPGLLELLVKIRLHGHATLRNTATILKLKLEFSEEDIHLLEKTPFFNDENFYLEWMTRNLAESKGRYDQFIKDVLTEHLFEKTVLFSYSSITAKHLFEFLSGFMGNRVKMFTRGQIDRQEHYEAFLKDPAISLLVTDRDGETGLNIQACQRLIHADLPFSPNRIEQRIGRVDRIGFSGDLRNVTCLPSERKENPLAGWYLFLNEGLGVFRHSISSLQFVVDLLLPKVLGQLFEGGPSWCFERSSIDALQEQIRKEKARLDEQEILDASEEIEQDPVWFQKLCDRDSDWQRIRKEMEAWIVEALNFKCDYPNDRADEVLYDRRPQNRTLVPPDVKLGVPVLGTYRRETAIITTKGLRLFRVGDDFIDGLDRYIRWDDRGRSYAFKREIHFNKMPGIHSWAGFRLDFIVEGDISPVRKFFKRKSKPAREASLRNLLDGYLEPRYYTLFLKMDLGIEKDPVLLEALSLPFSRSEEGGTDTNLTKERVEELNQWIGPMIWPERCQQAALVGEKLLFEAEEFRSHKESSLQRALMQEEDRLLQLQARVEAGYKDVDLSFEQEFWKKLLKGLEKPKVILDSIGFIALEPKGEE